MDYKEFTGLRNDRPIERFEPTDLSVAQNIDIDNSGAISMRQGYVLQSAGAKHSLWSNQFGTTALYVSGSSLFRLNSDLTSTSIMTGLTSGMTMSYQGINGMVYFSNGIQSGIMQDGTVRSWGLQVPPSPAVTATVGNMPAGDYQYTVTYFRNDGQESGAALAGTISLVDGSGLSFTLPVSNEPTVTSKGLYLSTPNGEVMFLAMTVPNSQTSALYQNDTLELNLPLETQFLSAPPAGQLVAYYRGRMFVAVGDRIYPSEPHAHELFDLRKNIWLDGKVTMMATIEDKERSETDAQNSGFFVGTEKSCGVMVGMDVFDYVPKMSYGAIMGAMDYVDGSLFGDNSIGAREIPIFLTSQGLCVGMPEMNIKNLTRTKYTIPAYSKGACLFKPGPNMFIASSN